MRANSAACSQRGGASLASCAALLGHAPAATAAAQARCHVARHVALLNDVENAHFQSVAVASAPAAFASHRPPPDSAHTAPTPSPARRPRRCAPFSMAAAERMSAALADFAPDWPVVLEVAAVGDKAALAVRAAASGDTPLHAAAYWGELPAIGACRAAAKYWVPRS